MIFELPSKKVMYVDMYIFCKRRFKTHLMGVQKPKKINSGERIVGILCKTARISFQ